MTKYQRLRDELAALGRGGMRVFGHSMEPIIESGAHLEFVRQAEYAVGDVVFCKVRGRYIDAHRIVKRDGERYLIANNRGRENGWTRQVFGRVVLSSKDA